MDELAALVPKWVFPLMKQGNTTELIAVKASVKAGLGGSVQALLCGIEILEQFEQSKGAWAISKISTKAEIRDLMVALSQLNTLHTDEFLAAAPDFAQKFVSAKQKVTELIGLMVAEIKWGKGQMATFHETYRHVVGCIERWDFTSVKHLLENSDTENGKKVAEDMKTLLPCPGLNFQPEQWVSNHFPLCCNTPSLSH